LESVQASDRLVGGLWVSFLPQNKQLTLDALRHAGEPGIVALKTTFLLGGNPDPSTWDADTAEIAEACFAAAEEHDLVFHFHNSAGGSSDINNSVPMVEAYGRRIKIYLVHFGGGVSGHIKLVPQFLDWVEQGFRVYCDTTWAIGFGARWLMTEIERRGIGEDRVLFASDEPWSDFWGEYWKINGAPVSDELKQRVLYQNYEQLYGNG
jgi:predicted TIM-barrel fold metal-dependent hydrolase